MAEAGKDELPGLRDQAKLGGRARRGIERDLTLAQNDPALREYLARMRVSSCPGCKRTQWTPRGEPVMCPACMGRKGTAELPPIPMGTGRRRRGGSR
jgi:hypothetical protein